jgi:hypothetical protein
VTDPVKAIHTVNQRLARLAAIQTLTALLPAVIVVVGVAVALQALGTQTWERWGYQLATQPARNLQLGLLVAAALGLAGAIVRAYLSFRRNKDPIGAAELIDRKLGCRQEVLTLATLADGGQNSRRSPLFPVLWRRAAEYLDKLDPAKAFPFQAKGPLKRALVLIGATAAMLAVAVLALLVTGHSPLSSNARQLRKLAHELAATPGDTGARELADKLVAAANLLENPKVPPETKLEQLARVEREIEVRQHQQQQRQPPASSQAKTAGKGNQGAGTGKQGNSQGKEGTGQGQGGSGPGQGTGSAQGSGKGTGEANGKTAKSKNQLAQLSKDISKAKAQLEAESAREKTLPQPESGAIGQKSRSPGAHPDQTNIENAKNPANLNKLKPGQERQEQRLSQSTQGNRKDFGSPRGDTHLGQFPEAGNFERFYKAGEHGPPLDIKNARYVLFRIPPATISGGGGKSVIDNQRPNATVPYQNLPLGNERIAADPDEHQLIPPRYRDLLR